MAVIIEGDDTARQLNKLAREQMKYKLLADILIDMQICKLEGWDVMSHLQDLNKLITDIIKRQNV